MQDEIIIDIENPKKDDFVSREAVKAYKYHRTMYPNFEDYVDILPCVQPKPIECDDAISRDAVIGKVKELFSMGECYCDEHSIIGMINDLPPVTQKSGKWIPNYYFYGIYDYTCSECEKHSKERSAFCPNCGVKMESEEK